MARAKMLLVEDDAALAELLIWHFKREDFENAHTADGEEALLMAQENVPDIVLLDWLLESLSGLEVCRRLRRMNATANRSEEHTSDLQSLMRISYAVFCLKKKQPSNSSPPTSAVQTRNR